MKDGGGYQRAFVGPRLVLPQRTADPPHAAPKPPHAAPTVINAVVRSAQAQAQAQGGERRGETRGERRGERRGETRGERQGETGGETGGEAPSASPPPPPHAGFHASPPRLRSPAPLHADGRRARFLPSAPSAPSAPSLPSAPPLGPDSPQRRLYAPFRTCPLRHGDRQLHTEQIGSALLLDQKDWSSQGHTFARSKRYTAISPVVSHMPDINPEADYAQDQFTVDRSVRETMRKYGPSFHSKLPRTVEKKIETGELIGPGTYEVDVQPRPRYAASQDWVFRSTLPRASPKRVSAALATEPVYYSITDDERHRHRRAVTMPKSPRFAARTTDQVPGPGAYIDPLQWGPKQINTFVTQTNMQTTRTPMTH